jgi:hypothetical protein
MVEMQMVKKIVMSSILIWQIITSLLFLVAAFTADYMVSVMFGFLFWSLLMGLSTTINVWIYKEME